MATPPKNKNGKAAQAQKNLRAKELAYATAKKGASSQAQKNLRLKELANATAKKRVAPTGPVDPAFNKDRGGLNRGTPKPKNGIIKLDPRESNGGFNKKPKPIARKPRPATPGMGAILPSRGAPKLRKSNPIMNTTPIKKISPRKKAY